MQTSDFAFVANLGRRISCNLGRSEEGGDLSSTQGLLRMFAGSRGCWRSLLYGADTATLGDGSVVTWGDTACGRDSRYVQGRLKDARSIRASNEALAAILAKAMSRPGKIVTKEDAAVLLKDS